MPMRALSRSFFLDDPGEVARALLGKLLVRRFEGELLAGRIVETEAYYGADDAAAHAAAGRTARTEVLFGPPGHAYVYFIYGMHTCLNISCEPEGKAGCILLRALEPVIGLATMARLRGLNIEQTSGIKPAMLTSGPGRLCQAMGITRALDNGVDVISDGVNADEIALLKEFAMRTVTDPLPGFANMQQPELRFARPGGSQNALHVFDDGYVPGEIGVTPRIGISKSAEMPARFIVRGSRCVSGPKRFSL